uniref:Nuclear receptor domain-containing protein n=1 Tax=Ditylenchus dipsaci TaxID=166011 RepID=A0A915DR97_9BILA
MNRYAAERVGVQSKEVPNSCLICGRKTKCMHYDIPSCFGCKSFFRRIIVSGVRYHCDNEMLRIFRWSKKQSEFIKIFKELLLRHMSLLCTILTDGFYSYEQNEETFVFPNGWIPSK